jgi:hypothetical protein
MIIEFVMPASPAGDVFDPHAFDSAVGEAICVKLTVGGHIEGTLVRAEVAEDRRTAKLAIDVPLDSAEFSIITGKPADGGVSVGFDA